MKAKLHINRKQSGFTLLESLMALFVLTVGILGVAGMQMQGMRAGNVAKQRMLAVSYAEELLERVRANPRGVEDYANPANSHGCSSGNICTAAQMAADDLFIWNAAVDSVFPGTPTVTMTIVPVDDPLLDPDDLGREITIDISWDDRGDTYAFSSSALINIER